MKNVIVFFVCVLGLGLQASIESKFSLSLIARAEAQPLSDSLRFKLKKIAANIDKTRESLASQGQAAVADDFKAKQLQQRIDSYGSALAKMPSDDDPKLLEAIQNHRLLVDEFRALVSGAAEHHGDSAQPQTVTVEAEGKTLVKKELTSPATSVAPLVSGQRVRVKKLVRELEAVRNSIKTEGPSELQDVEIVAKHKKRLNQFTEAIKRYPQAQDPDVIAAGQAYLALRTALQQEFSRAKSQLEQLGDVFARLRLIENRDHEYPVPSGLKPPFDAEQVQQWLNSGSKARSAAEFDFKQLQEIAPIAHLPEQTVSGRMAEYSFRDLDRLGKMVRARFDGVQESYAQTQSNIKSKLAELGNQVQQGNARETAERVAKDRSTLDEMVLVAESSVILETVLQRPLDQVESSLEAVRQRRENYDLDREKAIDESRLPEAATTDPAMMAIAREVIARPHYAFGEHGPIVLNTSDIKVHELETSEIDIDKVDVSSSGDLTMSGTKTTYFYKWQQFQFAAPLREEGSDLWRIYYINAKNYSSGAPSTPLNEWISGGVVEGELIRGSNF